MEKLFRIDTGKVVGQEALRVLDSQAIEEELIEGIAGGLITAYGEEKEGEERLCQLVISVKVSIVGLFVPAQEGQFERVTAALAPEEETPPDSPEGEGEPTGTFEDWILEEEGCYRKDLKEGPLRVWVTKDGQAWKKVTGPKGSFPEHEARAKECLEYLRKKRQEGEGAGGGVTR